MIRLFLKIFLLLIVSGGTAWADDITGIWKGSYFCYPSNLKLALSIDREKDNEGGLVARFAYEVIDPTGRDKHSGAITLTGTYDLAAKSLSLIPDRRQREHFGRPYEILGLVGENGEMVGRIPNAEPGSCTFLIANRADGFTMPDDDRTGAISGTEMRALRQERAKFLAKTDIPKLCDQILHWARRLTDEYADAFRNAALGLMVQASYPLLGDDEFTAAFGKTYDELTLTERSNLLEAMRKNCGSVFRRHYRELQYIGSVFNEGGQLGRRQALSGAVGIRHLRSWRDHALKEADTMTVAEDSIDRLDGYKRAAGIHLVPLWPSERAAFVAAVDKAITRLAPVVALFRAETASKSAADYDGFVALSSWTRDNEGLLNRLEPDQRDKATAIVDKRIDAILQQLLPADLASMPLAGTDQAALDASAQWHLAFSGRYGMAVGRDAFKGVLDEFWSRRGKTLSSVAHETTTELETLQNISEVDNLVNSVLAVPGDRMTDGGRAIAEAADKRWQALETELFLTRFSPRERELMGKPGQLNVPISYTAPDSEEVRLAILREIGSVGGTMVDPYTANYAIPPFGELGFTITVALQNASELSCRPIPGAGYECSYRMPLRAEIPQSVRDFFSGSPLHAWMVDFVAVVLDQHDSFTATDHFLLTPGGWKSPTAASRGLQAIIEAYSSIAHTAR